MDDKIIAVKKHLRRGKESKYRLCEYFVSLFLRGLIQNNIVKT